MTPDDAHTSHNHGFELPDAPQVVERSKPRPWRAVAGVAVCLGLAGIVTGLIVARRESVSDAQLLSDALQREELRDGWKALGAAAVRDAELNRAPASPAESAAAAPASAAAPPNVVIVNVPAQGAPAAPSNVTNINLPNGVAPAPAPTVSPGDAQNMSGPPVNFSPVQGYLPPLAGYTSTPASVPPQTGVLPLYNYGTSPSGVPPLPPAVGNGSIPGSTPNPALPNNGLVGTPALPGQPNSVNGSVTPSAPVGAAMTTPSTPSLPSGFSVP
jgi:hypothetical protein